MSKFGWMCLGFCVAFSVAMWFTMAPLLVAVCVVMALVCGLCAVIDYADRLKPVNRVDDREWKAAQKRRGF